MNSKAFGKVWRMLAGILLCIAAMWAQRLCAQNQSIDGHPGKSIVLSDLSARFEKDTGHLFGFDDYTNWTKPARDYYGLRPVGKCSLPFASVALDGVGSTFFWLKSSPAPSTVSFSESSGFMFLSPSSTLTSTTVSFYPTSGWGSIADLEAELDSKRIARLRIKGFANINKSVGITLVHDTNFQSPDMSTTDIQDALTNVFRQACISLIVTRCNAITVPFDINGDGKLDISSSMTNEMSVIIQNARESSYNYSVFIVSKSTNTGWTGYTLQNQQCCFIFSDEGATACTVAHEMGHCMGLPHTFNTGDGPPSKGRDIDNLMDPYSSNSKFKLRFEQWISLRSFLP